MTVVLLDPRFPTMIPAEAFSYLQGSTVEYTDEVPIRVRWCIADYSATIVDNAAVLVSTNALDPRVIARADRGEEYIIAPSRGEEVIPQRFRAIDEACSVMARSCDRGQWEQAQTHESLIPYLREEVEECIQAIDAWSVLGDSGEEQLKKELSDIFLQVLFHAEIARRRHAFDFNDVAAAFVDKMRARAPYLFDGSTGTISIEEQDRLWKKGKSL